MSFTPISLQATRANPDGSPASGTISFTLNAEMLNGTESIQPAPISGVLNPSGQLVQQNGQPVVLLANDDSGTTPADPSAAYVVQENINGSSVVEYSIIISHDDTIIDTDAIFTAASAVVKLSNVLASSAMVGQTLVASTNFPSGVGIIAYDPTQNTLTLASDATSTVTESATISGAVDLSTLAQYEPAPEVVTYIPFTLDPAQTNGQVPTWNATDKRWEPMTPSGGGGTPSDTVVGPDDFGADSSPGSSSEYSRGDHDHGLPDAPSGVALSLSYNGVGPFDVPVSSLPVGWAESGTASMVAQLTTGDGLITGLLDSYGNPIPDGFTFPATIFVEGATIYDIVASNAYIFGNPGQTGISWWGGSGGSPTANIGPNALIIQNLPTTDPAISGAFWNYNGQIVASGFTPPASSTLDLTVNSDSVTSEGLLPFQVTKQPLVPPSGILQPLPPLFGFTFTGVPTTYSISGSPTTENICAGPDGNLWITDNAGFAWRMNTTGDATSFALTGAAPRGICAGPDGNLWVCDANGGVWKVTPGGSVTQFTIPSANTQNICAGPDGNLWTTDIANGVWRVTPLGVATQFVTGSGMYGICAGPDGSIWATDPGGSSVIVFSTAGAILHTFSLGAGTTPQGICAGPDGNVWISGADASGNAVAWRMTLDGSADPFVLESSDLGVGICVGGGGDLWVSLFSGGDFFKVTVLGAVTPFATGSAGGWVCSGPDGNLWINSLRDDGNIVVMPFAMVTGMLTLTALPASSAGLPAGTLWNNSGVVNVA